MVGEEVRGRGMRWDKDNTVATGSRLSGDDTFLSGQNSIDKPAFYSHSVHIQTKYVKLCSGLHLHFLWIWIELRFKEVDSGSS